MNASSINYTLAGELVGPAIAVSVGVEFLLSLTANLFICLHTLINGRKSLKKSSTLFLFNLALSNLLMTVLYMPFLIIASAAEEWIFGDTDEVRNVLCQIHGFLFAYTTSISIHTIAAISFDRFLFIVKPHLHRRFMTWKISMSIIVFIWIYSIILDITPYFGLGEYLWSMSTGGCLPLWVGNRDYVIYFSTFGAIPFTIIIVTSTWTFTFTKGYLQRHLKEERRQSAGGGTGHADRAQNSIYSERIRNLFGVFGTLLIFNILTSLPFVSASVIGLIVGLDNVPEEVYTTVFILFLLSNVTNSIIQSYFRKELLDTIKKYWNKVFFFCRRRRRDEEPTLMNKHGPSHPQNQAVFNASSSLTGVIHQGGLSGGAHSKEMVVLVASGDNDPTSEITGRKERLKSVDTLTISLDGISDDDHVTTNSSHVTNRDDHVITSNGDVTISLYMDDLSLPSTDGHVTPPDDHVSTLVMVGNDHVTIPINPDGHVTTLVSESDSHVTSPDVDHDPHDSPVSQIENKEEIEE